MALWRNVSDRPQSVQPFTVDPDGTAHMGGMITVPPGGTVDLPQQIHGNVFEPVPDEEPSP